MTPSTQTRNIVVAFALATFAVAVWLYHSKQLSDAATRARNREMQISMNRVQPTVFSVRDVREGTVVTEKMIEVRMMPSKSIPGGALWTPNLAVGLVAKHGFENGTLLTTYHFGLDDSDPQFSAEVGEGFKRMRREMQRLADDHQPQSQSPMNIQINEQ